jgi:hypothetical protein
MASIPRMVSPRLPGGPCRRHQFPWHRPRRPHRRAGSELASAVFGICSAQEAGALLLRERVGLLTGVLLSHWRRADQAADKTESVKGFG